MAFRPRNPISGLAWIAWIPRDGIYGLRIWDDGNAIHTSFRYSTLINQRIVHEVHVRTYVCQVRKIIGLPFLLPHSHFLPLYSNTIFSVLYLIIQAVVSLSNNGGSQSCIYFLCKSSFRKPLYFPWTKYECMRGNSCNTPVWRYFVTYLSGNTEHRHTLPSSNLCFRQNPTSPTSFR